MSGFDFSQMDQVQPSQDHSTSGGYASSERDDAFRQKVALQQFLNHNAPIFKAFAYKGIEVSEVTDTTILVSPTEDAHRLTRLVASLVLQKPIDEIAPKEMAVFRTEAAQWIARRWSEDEEYDVEVAAQQIAKAVLLAGKDWDHDPFKDDRISTDASLMMSAAGVTTALMGLVEIYDFRKGRNTVLSKLLDAVIGTSIEVVGEMLPKSASKGDIANLTQTVVRNFSSIMEAVYERHAREVVMTLDGKDTQQKVAWLIKHEPLEGILAEFKSWAMCFVGFALATSRRIAAPAPQRGQDGSAQTIR